MWRVGNAVAAALLLLLARTAGAADIAGAYRATWAGLPAGDIRLALSVGDAAYRAEITIVATGLPRLLTRFRAEAVGEGSLAADGAAAPARYDARYDLRKRRDSRVSLRFLARDGGRIAERDADDTSRKPPLADEFRRNVVDPLSAFAAIRRLLQLHGAHPGDRYAVPVFDGARRFDVMVAPAGSGDGLIRLTLSLKPIAGFKGETSEDGDPDSAPRPVEVAFTDDARLMPVSLRVSIAYLPLTVRLDHVCASVAAC